MTVFLPQNPGIDFPEELTNSELLLIQALTSLGDPGGDRILFWDESSNAYAFLTAGSGLSISGTTISVTGGGTIDGSGSANQLTYWVDTDTIGALDTATYPSLTELSYIKGLTSAVQTQLNNKSATGHTHTKTDLTDIADFLLESEVDADIKTLSLPANTTISTFAQSFLDDADEATFKATVNLEIGVDVQAYDAQLASLAALTYAGNGGKFIRLNAGETDFEFATISGSGDVSKVGIPVDNQIAVWTGDGTIEGTSALTFDGTTLITTGDFNANDIVSASGNFTGVLGVNIFNGANSLFKFNDFTSGLNAILDTSAITTADKTFAFPDASGTLPLGTGNANEIAYWTNTNTLGTLATATYPSLIELSYIKGVTSAIQTQLDAKFTLPSFTSGSVLFSNGTTIAQDNTNFFWDDTNNRLSIGNPSIKLGPVNWSGTAWATVSGSNSGLTINNGSDQISYVANGYVAYTGSGTVTMYNILGNLEFQTAATKSIIFNQSGLDQDFRVEGDTDANLFFLDASTDSIGIGTGVPDRKLHVEVPDAGTNAVIYATRFSHITSGTATTGFGIGHEFELENASGTNRVVATQEYAYSDATNATEDATWKLKLIKAGTLTEALGVDSVGALTVAGGIILGANNLTMTGSLAETGARVTKGWFTDIESTNMPTVGGTVILTSLTAPQFTTIELGHASDTTLSRVSAGLMAIEGNNVARSTDVQIFTADGTWTKPANAKYVEIILIGAGGGGGSGRKGAAGSDRVGGGGGAGGGYSKLTIAASFLGSTEIVTVGVGGTGGIAQSTNSTDGNNGVDGENTTFGSWFVAQGGALGSGGTTVYTNGGIGGYGSELSRGGFGGGGDVGVTGETGGPSASSLAIRDASLTLTAGGGGGGSIDTSNNVFAGGNGGVGSYLKDLTGYIGGTGGSGTVGGNGTATTVNYPYGGGAGGGGGARHVGGNAYAGGNGAIYGAGGGGGGASTDSVGNSGAGGNGADGIAIIITYF